MLINLRTSLVQVGGVPTEIVMEKGSESMARMVISGFPTEGAAFGP